MYLAEKWGTAPWIINGEQDSRNAKQIWFRRGVDYYEQTMKKKASDLEALNNG